MNATNQGSKDNTSLKSNLVTMGMAALFTPASLGQPVNQSDDIIVAGGTEVSTEAHRATHHCEYCWPCFSGLVDA